MVWHLIKPLIGELSKPFRDASLELLKVEKGVETGAPPWKSCVTKTNSVMGFATGYLYIKERSGKNAKKQVENRFNFLTFRFVCATSENFVLTNKVFFFPSSAIFTHLERRAILNLVSKLTHDCIDSSLLRFMTGLENACHPHGRAVRCKTKSNCNLNWSFAFSMLQQRLTHLLVVTELSWAYCYFFPLFDMTLVIISGFFSGTLNQKGIAQVEDGAS